MKRMPLRRDDTCATCAAAIAAGTTAWWDASARRVTCASCHDAPSMSPPEVSVPPEVDRGVAGASARREGARRSDKRRQAVRARHPRLGGAILALTDDPSSTKVWARGAVGEEKVGAVLEAAQRRGLDVLHDRRMPRSRANIDHLVVAPSGIWVVDAKRYTGKLERRDVGGWRRTDLRLLVNGRDRTSLVESVAKQVAAVDAALVGGRWEQVPVHGCLCFVDTYVGWFAKPFRLGPVLVSWPTPLVATMVADGALGPADRSELLRELAGRFPPA